MSARLWARARENAKDVSSPWHKQSQRVATEESDDKTLTLLDQIKSSQSSALVDSEVSGGRPVRGRARSQSSRLVDSDASTPGRRGGRGGRGSAAGRLIDSEASSPGQRRKGRERR